MEKQTQSIQGQLILWLTVTIVLLYGISAVGVFYFVRHTLINQVDHHLEKLADDFIAETHVDDNGKINAEFHELNLANYQQADQKARGFYELWNQKGQIICKSGSLGAFDLPFSIDSPESRLQSVSLPGGFEGRAIFVTFTPSHPSDGLQSGTPSGDLLSNPVHLVMAESTTDVSGMLWILATTLALTAMTLAIVTLLLVGFFVRKACFPIVALGNITSSISLQQMNVRLPTEEAPSELRPLIVEFNNLVERFQNGVTRERRFSIDIAHELRTPLAELQVLMDVGNNSGFPDFEVGSIEDPRVIYRKGEDIIKRLRTLVEALTAIYRGETQSISVDIQSVDIDKVLGAAIAIFPRSDQARFSCLPTVSKATNMDTDPAIVRAVLDNLLNNAVSHSPPNSAIEIRYEPYRVAIENRCDNLAESDLERLDEAFWQNDPARSDSDHVGLGLTMVAVYINLLKGTISRELLKGVLTTRLTFPNPESELGEILSEI